ncbi:MAG TPA: FAD-binding oxidoreductase [Nevskiaceae bacterium]|nr:FAD-binding oxidoreductase [Nevskiaceae bacterium]
MDASVPTPTPPPTGTWRRLAASPWLRPLNDPALLDGWLGRIDPLWSVTEIRARIVARIRETADTWTFVLRPNRHWTGFAPGQHVLVGAEIGGRRVQRCYSLSRAPDASGTLAITVKRQAGGSLSTWLHDTASVGTVLGLSTAAGTFVLPATAPDKLLLLSAGSGITPMRAHLQALLTAGYRGDLVVVHACRNPDDVIYGAELERLARETPNLRVHFHFTRRQGRLDAKALAGLVPDRADRHTLVCGPASLMAWVSAQWRADGIADRLQLEHFGAPVSDVVEGAAVTVQCAPSGRTFQAVPGKPLLTEAEGAGLRPLAGCRVGLCHTCKCRKTSGTVKNLLTGAVSSAPDELIQLCISTAQSDLALDLQDARQ